VLQQDMYHPNLSLETSDKHNNYGRIKDCNIAQNIVKQIASPATRTQKKIGGENLRLKHSDIRDLNYMRLNH